MPTRRFDPFGKARLAAMESELATVRQRADEMQAAAAAMSLRVEEATAIQQEYQFLKETSAFYQGGDSKGDGTVSPERRKEDVERSRRQFLEDALIQRAALTYFAFVFGRGISQPRLAADFQDALLLANGADLPASAMARRQWRRQNAAQLPEEVVALDAMIRAFWTDPLNRRYVTGYEAQRSTYLNFFRDGEWPLLLFPIGEGGGMRFRAVPIDSLELTETIEHPDKPGIVLWFLRRYSTRVEGSMSLRETADWYPTVDAYLDPEAAKEVDPTNRPVFGVTAKEVKKGVYLYLTHASFAAKALRGYPQFWTALKWSGATVDTVSNLRTWLRARATWAWRMLRPGGSAAVSATASKLESKLDGTQPVPPIASVLVHGKGIEEVEGLDIGSSGAAAFKIAIDTLLNMVCAATGIPKHYFGDVSAGKLTTADSVELEVLKTMQAEQSYWTAVYDGLFQTMAQMAGFTLDTSRLIEIDFPAIDAKDAATLLPALVQAAAGGIAPQNYAARYAALALGEDDVEGWVEAVLGEADSGTAEPQSMTQLLQMVEDNPIAAAPIVLRLTQRIQTKLRLTEAT